VASAASHGASAARDLVRHSRKFIGDFPRLRLLDGPKVNAMVLSQELVTRQLQPCVAISLIYTVALGLPLAWALWSALETAARLRLLPSLLDAVENIGEMDQPTFHRHALKGDL